MKFFNLTGDTISAKLNDFVFDAKTSNLLVQVSSRDHGMIVSKLCAKFLGYRMTRAVKRNKRGLYINKLSIA